MSEQAVALRVVYGGVGRVAIINNIFSGRIRTCKDTAAMGTQLSPVPGTREAHNPSVGLLPHLHVVDAYHLAIQVAQRPARVALRKWAMEGQSQKR